MAILLKKILLNDRHVQDIVKPEHPETPSRCNGVTRGGGNYFGKSFFLQLIYVVTSF